MAASDAIRAPRRELHCGLRGVAQPGQSAAFGTRRSPVRIRPPRPSKCPPVRGLKVRAVRADHACMRTFSYIVVGYFLLSFMATGLVFGRQDPAGLLVLGGAAGAFVWLVRSYRGGKGVETIQRGDAARIETTERRLGARAAALVQRLPADPLELPWMVDLEYAYRDDPSQRERLESPYVETRSAAFAARDELERVTRDRRAGLTDAAILLTDPDRIASTLGDSKPQLPGSKIEQPSRGYLLTPRPRRSAAPRRRS